MNRARTILFTVYAFSCLFVAIHPVEAQSPVTPQRTVDAAQLESSGIRTLTSKHLILITDVPSSPEVDGLPGIFDAAVPQWAAYFGVDASKTAHWQARAYLIGDRRRFEALGLMPPGHENFVNGISMGAELWLYDQPTPYYRRHLLLHEGTHVFMASFLGGCGPGWYMEGTAELFGTHRLDEQTGQLTLRIMPGRREEVPMLGRVKLIRDAVADRKPLALDAVLRISNDVQLGNEAYAWCWALSKFLDAHPRYRERFRKLYKHVLDPKFNAIFRREFDTDWADLTAEWQAYVATLDHGYDFERTAIDFQPSADASGPTFGRRKTATVFGRETATVQADRGWQSTGIRLEAGKSYRISASGRFQIASEEVDGKLQPWPCEPGGITIEYHDGRPLGMLLGAIRPDNESAANSEGSFARPIAIGLQAVLKPAASGTLFLRVNDTPAHLDDNQGTLTVTIE
jgi:hypothetical protein